MEKIPTELPLPDTMPIMVLSGATHFPRSLMPMFIFEQRYRKMLRHALEGDRMFGVACAIPGVDSETDPQPVRNIFTAGLVRACVQHDDGTSHLMLQGLKRVKIVAWEQVHPFRIASIVPLENLSIDSAGEQELADELIALCQRSIEQSDQDFVSVHMKGILEMLHDPIEVADLVGHHFINEPSQRQELLEIVPVKEQIEYLISHVRGNLPDL